MTEQSIATSSASQAGPCVVCGLRDYPLSFGGPTICPSCDCGNTGQQKVRRQAERIRELEKQLAASAIDLLRYVNAADISGADVPHVVVEKLQRAIDASASNRSAIESSQDDVVRNARSWATAPAQDGGVFLAAQFFAKEILRLNGKTP